MPTEGDIFLAPQVTMFLLGTDRMGRDLLSRIMYGARVSMTLGLVGVFLSIVLGSVLGTISGYWGGWVDNLIQRVIEILSAFPDIPLWMALGASLPPGWSSIQIYFGITVILSIIRWGGLGTAGTWESLGVSGERFRDGGTRCRGRTLAHHHKTSDAGVL